MGERRKSAEESVGDAQDNAGYEADADVDGGGREDEAENFAAIGAESHADAEFVGASGDTVRNHAVKTYRGEDQGRSGKDGEESGDEFLLGVFRKT